MQKSSSITNIIRDVRDAIARESQLKKMVRGAKEKSL